jgi:hypothetical protein
MVRMKAVSGWGPARGDNFPDTYPDTYKADFRLGTIRSSGR